MKDNNIKSNGSKRSKLKDKWVYFNSSKLNMISLGNKIKKRERKLISLRISTNVFKYSFLI